MFDHHRHSSPSPLRDPFFWGVLLFALAVRVVVALGSEPAVWADSFAYVRSGLLMALHNNYWWHEIYRTPLYPFFLSIFYHLFGRSPEAGNAAILGQHLLGVVSTGVLFCIARMYFSRAVALVTAALFAVYPLQLYYETVVMTEALFTPLLLLSLWVSLDLLRRIQEGKRPKILAIGTLALLFALTTLTRPLAQHLLVCVLVSFVVFAPAGRRLRIAVSGAVCFAVCKILLLPWMWVNAQTFGFWGVSKDFGLNLYHRVIDIDERIPPANIADRKVYAEYLRARKKKQPEVTYFTVLHALERKRLDKSSIDDRMGAFALETLRANPDGFIRQSFHRVGALIANPRRSIELCEDPGNRRICGTRDGKILTDLFPSFGHTNHHRAEKLVYRYLKRFTFPYGPVTVIALIGAVLLTLSSTGTRRTGLLCMIGVLAYFYLIVGLMNWEEDRFRLPVDGLVLLFFSAAVLSVVSRLRSWIRLKT